jgi:hypothetical protein
MPQGDSHKEVSQTVSQPVFRLQDRGGRAQDLLHQDLPTVPETSISMPGIVLPPFPDNVPTHSLLIIDYELVKAGDPTECNSLWDAATKLGFW